MAKTSQRKGAPKVGNVRRSEHRKLRYQRNLRDRARRNDEKAIRLLDSPRKRAGKGKTYLGRPNTHRQNNQSINEQRRRLTAVR